MVFSHLLSLLPLGSLCFVVYPPSSLHYSLHHFILYFLPLYFTLHHICPTLHMPMTLFFSLYSLPLSHPPHFILYMTGNVYHVQFSMVPTILYSVHPLLSSPHSLLLDSISNSHVYAPFSSPSLFHAPHSTLVFILHPLVSNSSLPCILFCRTLSLILLPPPF